MSRKVDALKRVAVALGYGSAVSDYSGLTVEAVLKELAVKMECASSVANIKASGIAAVLDYIADNHGQEEKEPYDLAITAGDNLTLSVKRNGKPATAGADILYNGDKLVITAEADEGYVISSLTLNEEDIESGDSYIVNGHNVSIVAAAEAEETEE